MDYGKLLTKAWTTIWNNKFLIVLGVLASLGQGGGGGGGNAGGGGGDGGAGGGRPGDFQGFPDYSQEFQRFMSEYGAIIIVVVVMIVLVALAIGVALWVLNRTAQGGLIDGVNTIENGGVSGFGPAMRAGWGKIGRMLLISVLAALPSFILALIVAGITVGYLTSDAGMSMLRALQSSDPDRVMAALAANYGIAIGLVALCFPLILVSWAMQAIATFADRACVLEDKGVMDSYQRGFQVLRDNIGQAILLFLIQIGIGIALGFTLLVPTFAIALCCVLWPLLFVISGTIEAYFSTLWTLAWREWVGQKPGEPAAAPAM